MTAVATAIRKATLAAVRLHRALNLEQRVLQAGGRIDVFDVIAEMGVPLLVRPLDKLLGAFILDPVPGVLVTTERPLSVQRFTAAHELGHYHLKHKPSLDDDNILRRGPFDEKANGDLQELEANAFAAAFLLPRWLIDWHCLQQGWTTATLQNPEQIYQLSLRVGTSYEATCWTLQRYGVLSLNAALQLTTIKPKAIKADLLGRITPENYYSDVWVLSQRDSGQHVEGGSKDFVILSLKEHSGSGYMWEVGNLAQDGFTLLSDARENVDSEEAIGGPVVRRVVVQSNGLRTGDLRLEEQRQWLKDQPLHTFELHYDFMGPEAEGWSRAERKRRLEAA